MLYGWRSLEITVRKGPKAIVSRLNSKTLKHQRTPDSRELLIARAHAKFSIPTLKPSSTQKPKRFSARQTTLILQQNRNTTLNIKRWASQSHAEPIGTPKLTIGHFNALLREELQLHPPEHRHKLPQPGNPDKPLVQIHPQ